MLINNFYNSNISVLTIDGKSAAQNRWIAYNKAKGQYSSAMEHAVPEEFWIDRTKCKYTDADGKVQNPTLQACAEGISAVKAIAIAQSQGQKIYTINKENRDTALPKLTIGGAVGDEIRNAINAGKEVTFHENAINAFGWSGHGYIILDPETGVGAHLIDGGGSGGTLLFQSMLALFAIIEMIGYAGILGFLKILPVIAAINPLFRVLVGGLTLILSFPPDSPYAHTEATSSLELITSLVGIGMLVYPISPILFGIIYITLLIFVASLVYKAFTVFLYTKSEDGAFPKVS
jgi:hypothetical protein